MKASALKEVTAPKRIQVDIGEKTVTIGQFRFGELPLVLELTEKFYDAIMEIAKDKKSNDAQVFMKAAKILSTDFETVASLLSMCAEIDIDELKKMELEPIFDLGRAIYEVNKDFLLRKIQELQAAKQEAQKAQ